MTATQKLVDQSNAAFWDELCGTPLAQQLGITDASPENLERFDSAYLDQYPYLPAYLPAVDRAGEKLLEVGLGYGTVSQLLAERGLDYHGLDIAEGPAKMVRHRLAELAVEDPEDRVKTGSILEAPFGDAEFDHVVAIGCLHHTGDLPRGIQEVHRLLRPGGRAVVMVYNRRSWRRRLGLRGEVDEQVRGDYDRDTAGEAAPATEFISRREAKTLFSSFSDVDVATENWDYVNVLGRPLSRRLLLGGPAKLAGLDLYVTATK